MYVDKILLSFNKKIGKRFEFWLIPDKYTKCDNYNKLLFQDKCHVVEEYYGRQQKHKF